MNTHTRLTALIPLATGALWLLGPADRGVLSFLLSVVPGALLLAGGGAVLWLPDDLRAPRLAALGGVLGTLIGIPALFFAGLGTGLLLLLGSAASFVVAGRLALAAAPVVEGVPAPDRGAAPVLGAAIDETVLAIPAFFVPPHARTDRQAAALEVRAALELFRARGWLDKPDAYHVDPPALVDPALTSERSGRRTYENLSFESGYEPPAGVPGRERWLAYGANRIAHARVLRHREEGRPWLVCIHGAGQGTPQGDLSFLRLRELGLNLLLAVLPLHGPRKHGRAGVGEFVGVFPTNLVHAEAQAIWDLRRLLSWVRAQGAPQVGVYGLSLGGYTAALLASLEADLACVLAGVPASDFVRLNRRAATPDQLLEADNTGASWRDVEQLYRVISPLALAPRVPRERRFIFAATADRFVPPDQVRDLWLHWEQPRIAWLRGGHLSILFTERCRQVIRGFLTDAGLVR